ncbi:urease subunit beta [Kitasatospora sp. NPDC049285]|uniref:urease subunit beta n=1 Tax=Kitasatospora sp. NPDC049285 TaxID=3157096 RepID=UPI003435D9F3
MSGESQGESHGGVVPGEILYGEGEIGLNAGRPVVRLTALNVADRPIQIGSHYHLAEANPGLELDRSAVRGHRLNIPAGTAVRFEPGIPMEIEAVPLGGRREVFGLRGETAGPLDPAAGEGR